MNEKTTVKCVAKLSDFYVNYLNRCVPENTDALYCSIEDLQFKGHEDIEFEVLHIGDGINYAILYVRLPSGYETWVKTIHAKVVAGSLRNVPKKGKIHMGKTSLMGAVAHGIKSGRAFRGR